jgi:hypothetical protein
MIVQSLPHSKRAVSSRITLVRKIVFAVYCENCMEHTNTQCAQNAGFLNVKAGHNIKNTMLKGLS